jgi:hypothetical protein
LKRFGDTFFYLFVEQGPTVFNCRHHMIPNFIYTMRGPA